MPPVGPGSTSSDPVALPAPSRTHPLCHYGGVTLLDAGEAHRTLAVRPILEIRDLSVVFGGVTAVDRLTLSVAAGAVTSIIGPNGAGKTSLLNAVSGFVRARSGSIQFRDHELRTAPVWLRPSLGIGRTFQNLQLFRRLSVLDNVILGAHARQRTRLAGALVYWPRAAAEDRQAAGNARVILERVGLGDSAHRVAGSLPLAGQKLVGIARALACSPSLLLLDEPGAGMVRNDTDSLGMLISRLCRDDGVTVILVEHNMGLVMSVSGQVVVMNEGRLLAEGPPAAIRSHPEVLVVYLGHAKSVNA